MDGMDFMDRIDRAFERERAAREVCWPPEDDSVWEHVFRCVCCGRSRREELRREPDSEVCVRCVEAAGLWN